MKQSTIDDIRLSPLGSAYVHVPFCSHKCDFCDFAAFAGLDHMEDKYFEVLGKEIEQRIREVRSPISLNTIYFGGGTPAMVSAENIDSVLTTIKNLVEVEADLEVTLESTPQAISKDKVLAWRASGINRLSIGVGSLNDSELTAIGRDHTVDEALTGIEIACQGGFDCISLDLIYDLPTQNLSSWESTLSRAVELLAKYESIKHMSAYGLHLVGNSPLYSRFPRDSASYPDENAFVLMFELLVRTLKQYGFEHYEISNFTRDGHYSRHNTTYWRNRSYLAFGVGAHRYVDGWRSANYRSFNKYLSQPLLNQSSEFIDDAMRLKEAIMLGLRLRRGIDLDDFLCQYGVELEKAYAGVIERLGEGGFLAIENRHLFLTDKAVPVSNSVIVEFI